MNNLCGLSVSNHIGSMDHHIEIIQKHFRVCGNLLVATGKRKRSFYQCSEFAAHLFSVIRIDISNDVPGTRPSTFCYSWKQISISSISPSHIQELHHYLSVDGTCRRGMHGIVEMYMHAYLKVYHYIDLPSKKKEEEWKKPDPHPRGGSTCTTASSNAIIAWIKGMHTIHHQMFLLQQ